MAITSILQMENAKYSSNGSNILLKSRIIPAKVTLCHNQPLPWIHRVTYLGFHRDTADPPSIQTQGRSSMCPDWYTCTQCPRRNMTWPQHHDGGPQGGQQKAIDASWQNAGRIGTVNWVSCTGERFSGLKESEKERDRERGWQKLNWDVHRERERETSTV